MLLQLEATSVVTALQEPLLPQRAARSANCAPPAVFQLIAARTPAHVALFKALGQKARFL